MCYGPFEALGAIGHAIKEKPIENTLIILISAGLVTASIPAGFVLVALREHAKKHGYYNRVQKWL